MYLEVSSGRRFVGHSDIRTAVNVMFGQVITDADLAAFGIMPLYGTPPQQVPGMISEEGEPVLHGDMWVRSWTTRPMTDEEKDLASGELASVKATLAAAVDSFIADIYQRWFRFDAEYLAREAAARAFVAAGCQGDPGVWIAPFADAAGLAYRDAADLIIMQADSLRIALEELGALRMKKYAIHNAADVARAQAAHDDIVHAAGIIAQGLK